MALKACTVDIHELNETEHSLDVTAASLYEAIAQALAALRGHDWVGEIGRGLTSVTVKVRHPEVTHVVKIQDFENWLNRSGKSTLMLLRLAPAQERVSYKKLNSTGTLIQTTITEVPQVHLLRRTRFHKEDDRLLPERRGAPGRIARVLPTKAGHRLIVTR